MFMQQVKTNLKDMPTLLPFNVDWSAYFHNRNPVDVEIGCGRPHFFFDRAKNFAERNIVGIEWKFEFMEQAQRRIQREHHQNAAAFHGNAWLLVPLLFRANSISQVFVNFPDPWWKNKHKKRLVLNDVFLSALHERMTDDGFILLQTDVSDLFDSYEETIHEHGGFFLDKRLDGSMIQTITRAATHREKKCLHQGMTIFRGIFRKVVKR